MISLIATTRLALATAAIAPGHSFIVQHLQ